MRKLLNKLKFGAEIGFPIIPFAQGVGYLGRLAVNRGKQLAYSVVKLKDGLIDIYFNHLEQEVLNSRITRCYSTFRTKSRVRLLADDFVKDIDTQLKTKVDKTY